MPLPDHKRLVLRLIAIEELRPRPGTRSADAEERIAERVRSAFLDVSGAEGEFESADVTVQALIQQQLERVVPVRSLMRSQTEVAIFDRFFAQLRARVANKLCKKCAGGGLKPCKDAYLYDSQLLESRGLCIEVINKCYGYIREQIEAIHETWGLDDSAVHQPIDVQFKRHFVGGDPKGTRSKDRYLGAVGGFTDFDDDPHPGRRLSKVTLELDGRSFERRALLSIPYVIAHELVCHAFQGRIGVKRTSCERDCPFYEGWMDEVASLLLDAIVVRGEHIPRGAKRPALFNEHASHVSKAMSDFRKWRYKTDEPGRGSPETTWEQGQLAAQNALSFFRLRIVAGKDYDLALKLLVRLSRCIQRRDPTRDEASQIVLALDALSAFAASDKGSRVFSNDLHDLMFSPIQTTAWIKELDTRWANVDSQFI